MQHVQDQPLATWRIYHEQVGYPVIDVFVTENNTVQKILPSGIVYIDDNTIDVEFSEPRSGFAIMVI